MTEFPDLPQDWKRYDDLVIFFIDLFAYFDDAPKPNKLYGVYTTDAPKLIKVYAIDTTDASIYHVVDFPSPDDIYNEDLDCISVVAYGTKIYAVGGLGICKHRSNYQNTWICDIAGNRQWSDGPPLLSGKFKPILFTLDHHLYVLDACPSRLYKYEVRFEVLNLQADVNNVSWEALSYSVFRYSAEYLIEAVAIDEGQKRVYCKLSRREYEHRWFIYEVVNNEWKDFGSYDQPVDLPSGNLVRTAPFHFSHIFDGKIFLFDAPLVLDSSGVFQGPDSGDLVLYDLQSDKIEAVKEGLKWSIDFGCHCLVYFVVHLRGGDICLVCFFPNHESSNHPEIGELIVYQIKSEEREEDKNKHIPSAPITRKLKSRSYKMVPVPSEEDEDPKYGYWPREVQQLSQLRCI